MIFRTVRNLSLKKDSYFPALAFSCFIAFISLFLLFSLFSPKNAEAKSVADSMGDFWNNIGGSYSNGTDAGGYQLQGAGYYTGGSFTARTKVVNVNPITITPPGIRAGCGGIDVYTGAFSHINADQFIALAKAIPSNAIGFAFDLALATMSPEIKTVKDRLQSVIDQINSTNLNSCDLAQNMVASGLKYSGLSQKYCEVSANSKGYATDYARAKNECGTGGKSTQYNKDADSANGENRTFNKNVAWEILKKSSILADGKEELAQFVQALTGTIIIKSPENDSDGPQMIYKKSIVVDDDTIKAFLEGGTVTILACDEKDKCLNPTERNITITEDKAFKKRISSTMGEMVTRLSTGQKFDAKHIDLVNKTSIPIHKAMVVQQAYFGSASAAGGINPEQFSSIIAVDILYHYFDEILRSVQEQSQSIQNFDQSIIVNFQKGVETARAEISRYKVDANTTIEKAQRIAEQTQKIESILSARMSAKMKANLAYSSKF